VIDAIDQDSDELEGHLRSVTYRSPEFANSNDNTSTRSLGDGVNRMRLTREKRHVPSEIAGTEPGDGYGVSDEFDFAFHDDPSAIGLRFLPGELATVLELGVFRATARASRSSSSSLAKRSTDRRISFMSYATKHLLGSPGEGSLETSLIQTATQSSCP
jgi:hypothetical protein